jgi:hypothetical protein
MNRRYTEMHELSRHVIHKSETLEVAARTLKAMIESHGGRSECSDKLANDPHQTKHLQVKENLRYYADFLENLRLRSQAFEKRLQNEIILVNCF